MHAYKLIHRDRLLRIDRDVESPGVTFVIPVVDLAEIIERMRKQDSVDKAVSWTNSVVAFLEEHRSEFEVVELTSETLHKGLFDWESEFSRDPWEDDWAPTPRDFWEEAVDSHIRTEHSARLIALRSFDFERGTDLVHQIGDVYPDPPD